MAGGAVVFWYPLGFVPTSHFADLTDDPKMGTDDVLRGFNHLLQSPSFLGRDRNISGQDALCCYSVKG